MVNQPSFDPIRSEDYVAPLQESYKAINEGMNNYWNQETSNAQRAAEIAGRDVQALADMSSTLGEYFTKKDEEKRVADRACLLYTSPSPRDGLLSRMPSSA